MLDKDLKRFKRIWRSEMLLLVISTGVLVDNIFHDRESMKETWPVYLTQWHLVLNVACQFSLVARGYQLNRAANADRDPANDGGSSSSTPLYSPPVSDIENDVKAKENALPALENPSFFGSVVDFDPRQFSLTSSVLVAGLFWTILGYPKASELIPHGAMAVCYLANSYANKLPYQGRQGLFVAGLGLIYSVFSLTYAYSGGYTYDPRPGHEGQTRDFVYSVLDWKAHPGKAAAFALGGVFVATPLVVLALSVLKNFVAHGCCPPPESSLTTPIAGENGTEQNTEEGRTALQIAWYGR